MSQLRDQVVVVPPTWNRFYQSIHASIVSCIVTEVNVQILFTLVTILYTMMPMIDPLGNLTNSSDLPLILAKIGDTKKLRIRNVDDGTRATSKEHTDIFVMGSYIGDMVEFRKTFDEWWKPVNGWRNVFNYHDSWLEEVQC